jgi:hypothetical protein
MKDCETCEATLTKASTQDWGGEAGRCDECIERAESQHAERVIQDQREQAQVDWYRDN